MPPWILESLLTSNQPISLFDLSGKVAVVTGGNGGIGLGCARGLAKAGASIAIWARNDEKSEVAKRELEAWRWEDNFDWFINQRPRIRCRTDLLCYQRRSCSVR